MLGPGDRAIDATMGNGHDTCHLASCVTPDGRVIAFDIQADALANTAKRLNAAGLAAQVTTHRQGHEQMTRLVPVDWPGTVSVVMFNLGYLPGGDKRYITQADTTLAALDQSLRLLRPGGLLSLMLYRNHEGAAPESAAIEHWVAKLGPDFRVSRHESAGPCLFLITTPEASNHHSTRESS